MARGIRDDTITRIRLAREKAPYSMGPLLGELAADLNVSAGIVAVITKAHEQTVLRWFFGQSEMQPQWIKASLKLFGVLIWMRAARMNPLQGDKNDKIVELTRHLKTFETIANSVS